MRYLEKEKEKSERRNQEILEKQRKYLERKIEQQTHRDYLTEQKQELNRRSNELYQRLQIERIDKLRRKEEAILRLKS